MPSPRVREEIKLTSPDGKEFTAKWRGNKRSSSKRIVRWKYAGINGEVVDDYGMDSISYPMALIFDGDDYDITAERFITSCHEIGKWEVTHPTKGYVALQLIDWTENDEPVRDANRIVIDTTWIDYIDPVKLKTPAQLLADAGLNINKFNDELLNRYADVDVGTFSKRASLLDTAKKISAAVDKILGPIAAVNDNISSQFLDTQRALQEIIGAGIVEPLALAGQIKDTIQLPMLGLRDLKSRLLACRDLAAAIFGIESGENGDTNIAMTKELGLFSAIGAVSIVQTTSEIGSDDGLKTQSDAIYLTNFGDSFSGDIDEHLDAEQTKMSSKTLGDKYVYGGEVLIGKTQMENSAKAYIKSNFFNLKREKTVTLKRDMSPIELTLIYYGEMGDGDENYIQFMRTNGLKSSRVTVLEAGSMVVVYV